MVWIAALLGLTGAASLALFLVKLTQRAFFD